jgi:hypothetical protein
VTKAKQMDDASSATRYSTLYALYLFLRKKMSGQHVLKKQE